MMTPRVTTNNDILHDEEFNGQEVEAAALPPPTEMAVNRREEADEPDDDETEPTSGRTNRFRFSRNQALTALAATAALVGTATVISRAASGSGKTSISSSMQAAAVADEVPGYELLGPGQCRDVNNDNFPNVRYLGPSDFNECGAKCLKCVGTAFPSQFVGFDHNPKDENCFCLVSQPVTLADFGQFDSDGECKASSTRAIKKPGTGPIAQTVSVPGYTCYKVGGGSKAGKTPKTTKRG